MNDDVESSARTGGGVLQSLLVVFGLNGASNVVLSLAIAPLLVNEPWNFATSWSLLVTVVVVVALRRWGLGPTVREAWTFGITALVGTVVFIPFGVGDPRLSGSLYPVLRGILACVAILAFAGVVTTLGMDDLRRVVKTEQ